VSIRRILNCSRNAALKTASVVRCSTSVEAKVGYDLSP
jgi:hypothetical protein